jgi:hypothetical protein
VLYQDRCWAEGVVGSDFVPGGRKRSCLKIFPHHRG